MVDISTEYLGLPLKNPLVVGSSGLTDTPEKVKELEERGTGAVVLKSIFEEEIEHQYRDILREEMDTSGNVDAMDYFDYQIRAETLDHFRNLVKRSKANVSIAVIASVNCLGVDTWIDYAKRFESVGADALELNVFILPADVETRSEEIENQYLEMTRKVSRKV